MDYLLAEGFRVQVTRKFVEKAIMHVRGIDPRTIHKWLRALVMFEYLIPVSVSVYRINPVKVPELFNLLREKPQTKIQ